MFLIMIFKKFGWTQNRYVMGTIYGFIYAVIFFVLLTLAQLYLNKINIKSNLLYSVALMVAMFFVYNIKWYFIKSNP